ncbi:putative CipA protein [Seiridium unicorne]|uniref:CipA protein n=1 Tax=Seiridium unicorne TaxID=138068 RepID=A0ABR2VIA2_9PEZI
MSQTFVKKVAIVGAAGTVGKHIVAALLKTGKHEVTAISRADSKAATLDGVKVARVDYDEPLALVDALRSQDVLIITMAVTAPRDTEGKLVKAAADAGVPFVLPNFWGPDGEKREQLGTDIMLGLRERATVKQIEDLGASAWIGMVTSFWYEMSLAGPVAFGMDYKNRKWTFYDDGEAKINVITLPQSGKAVAALLSLPIESSTSPSLSKYKNKPVYTASFCVSQRDMFASVLRVSGTKPEDWQIEHEASSKRFADGKKQFEGGDVVGFAKLLYARVFYPDGSGNYEASRGLENDVLGLAKEDIDEFTKLAIQRVESGARYGN